MSRGLIVRALSQPVYLQGVSVGLIRQQRATSATICEDCYHQTRLLALHSTWFTSNIR